MNPQQLEHFRHLLTQQKAALEALDSGDATATVVLDQSAVGRLSRMDAMAGQQMALETERRRKAQLLAIEAALRRISNNDYGYCGECGEAIVTGRLEFNPALQCCIACSQ